MKIRHLSLGAGMLAVMLAAGCSEQPDAPSGAAAPIAEEHASAGNLSMGDKLPDFELATLDGETYRLHDLIDGEHYVAVIWHAPTCPCAANCARAIAEEFTAEKYPDLRILGVVSDEIWDYDWYQEDLRAQSESGAVTFPVVIDREMEVIDVYGAQRTPTVWLADKEGRIRFWGAPENVLDGEAESGYRFLLKEAVDDLRAGREVATPRFEPIGCKISRKGT
ncbi:MAG: hypothetical protein PWP23_1110 [Candidatus Sumerlaeota bacterium]|nr:hypothetical protein [Candidatus Sumerlaeota bacterium]